MATRYQSTLATLLTSVRVGFFLAVRQVRRTSRWTNALVICIMILTFLNLVVVSGILVGLIQGAVEAVRERYVGELIVTNLKDRTYIEQSQSIITATRSLPGVRAVSARYIESGTVESEYKTVRNPKELPRRVATSFAGINPQDENHTTRLSDLLIEGSYLESDDYDEVLVGASLLDQYLDIESETFPVLSDVTVGSKIRITINDNQREVTVKGILKSKVDEIDRRIFFVDNQLRGLIGRYDYNVDEISVRIANGTSAEAVKTALLAQGFGSYAKIQTQEEAEPKFIKDIKQTFDTLGNIISSIGLVVAAITIFIVVFINAITRRKYIGIMKGIGIHTRAIELAYVYQSLFYAVVGTAIGSAFVFWFLEPFIRRHPIDFPFSDGILVVSFEGTLIRIGVLMIATLIASYVPAKMITRQNIIDAILNR